MFSLTVSMKTTYYLLQTNFHIFIKFHQLVISMQRGVPAYTVPQPEEAMSVLKDKASQLGVSSITNFDQ